MLYPVPKTGRRSPNTGRTTKEIQGRVCSGVVGLHTTPVYEITKRSKGMKNRHELLNGGGGCKTEKERGLMVKNCSTEGHRRSQDFCLEGHPADATQPCISRAHV